MSLFGGTGFLGLGGTGFGDTITNIYDESESFLEKASDFAISLPNTLVDLGESLGDQQFDTSSPTAQKFKQEAIEFKARQAGGYVGRSALGVGEFISNNILLIGGGILAFFLLK